MTFFIRQGLYRGILPLRYTLVDSNLVLRTLNHIPRILHTLQEVENSSFAANQEDPWGNDPWRPSAGRNSSGDPGKGVERRMIQARRTMDCLWPLHTATCGNRLDAADLLVGHDAKIQIGMLHRRRMPNFTCIGTELEERAKPRLTGLTQARREY